MLCTAVVVFMYLYFVEHSEGMGNLNCQTDFWNILHKIVM